MLSFNGNITDAVKRGNTPQATVCFLARNRCVGTSQVSMRSEKFVAFNGAYLYMTHVFTIYKV